MSGDVLSTCVLPCFPYVLRPACPRMYLCAMRVHAYVCESVSVYVWICVPVCAGSPNRKSQDSRRCRETKGPASPCSGSARTGFSSFATRSLSLYDKDRSRWLLKRSPNGERPECTPLSLTSLSISGSRSGRRSTDYISGVWNASKLTLGRGVALYWKTGGILFSNLFPYPGTLQYPQSICLLH